MAAGAFKAAQSASDLNEVVNKTQVVFGKQAAGVMRFGENAAQSIGLSERAALDAASTYGTLGKAAGLTGEDVAGFSVSLTKAAADLASFHNADISQVLEDIRSGLAGEVEPLRKYGILLNDAAMRQEALKMGLIKTTKDALSPQNKTLVAQRLILKNLGPAYGDFARTSDGAANQQRIMAAETENASATMGKALLPTLRSAQAAYIAVAGAAESHTTAVQVGVVALAGLAGAVVTVNAALKVYEAAMTVAAARTWLAGKAILGMSGVGMVGLVVGLTAVVGTTIILTRRTSEMDAAYRTAKDAVDNLSGAFDDETHAQLRAKEAHQQRRDAASSLADAQRSLNQLERQGKKGTDEYRDAQNTLRRAKLGLERATLDERDAVNAARESYSKARGAANQYSDRLVELIQAGRHEAHTQELIKSRTGDAAGASRAAAKVAAAFAQRAQALADELSASAAKAGGMATNAGRAQIKMMRASAAAAALARSLNHIPTKKEIDIFLNISRQTTAVENNRLNRATGGPMSRDRTYLVGERRAELFRPFASGVMSPRVPAMAGGGGGGGDVYVDVRISEQVVGKIADVRIRQAERGMERTLRANKTWEPS